MQFDAVGYVYAGVVITRGGTRASGVAFATLDCIGCSKRTFEPPGVAYGLYIFGLQLLSYVIPHTDVILISVGIGQVAI